MTNDDEWLNFYGEPDAVPPPFPAAPEGAIPLIPRATLADHLPPPVEHNAWAPRSLAIALVALVYGSVVAIVEINAVHLAYNGAGYLVGAPIPGGPAWLHGRFFTSGWAVAALLLIACAVWAGTRSLALIGRDSTPGLGVTVSALFVSSVALIVGNAVLFGFLGAISSLVVLGIYSDRHGLESSVSTRSPGPSGRTTIPSAEAPRQSPQASSPRGPILTFVGAVLGPLACFRVGGFVFGASASLVVFILAIRTSGPPRARGRAGHGWSIGAIVASSIWLVFVVVMLFFIWLFSQLEWA